MEVTVHNPKPGHLVKLPEPHSNTPINADSSNAIENQPSSSSTASQVQIQASMSAGNGQGRGSGLWFCQHDNGYVFHIVILEKYE